MQLRCAECAAASACPGKVVTGFPNEKDMRQRKKRDRQSTCAEHCYSEPAASTGKHCIHTDRSLRFADAKAVHGLIQEYFLQEEDYVPEYSA
jgi:hypothetical protein